MTAKTITMSASVSDSEHLSGASKKALFNIRKASLKSTILLNYEADEVIGEVTNKVKVECGHPIHEDLTNAFQRLRVHVGYITEMLEPQEVDINTEDWADHPKLKKIEVTGFALGGNDEHEGVTIIARRELRNKRILNIITPFVKFRDEVAPYDYDADLYVHVTDLIAEIELYIGGKHGAGAQLKMNFGEEDSLDDF